MSCQQKVWIMLLNTVQGTDRSGPSDANERLKIVGPRRQSSLGIDNFTGGLFPDTELPWSDRHPPPPRGAHNPFAYHYDSVRIFS